MLSILALLKEFELLKDLIMAFAAKLCIALVTDWVHELEDIVWMAEQKGRRSKQISFGCLHVG